MAEGLFNHQIRNQHQYKTNLLEHILFLEAVLGCADHQSVHHYTIESGESKPVFLPNSDEQLQSLAVRIHPLVIQWVEQQGKQDHTDDKIRENIDKTFARFCANASPSSLKALEPIQITYDQNGLHKIPLIQEYNLLTALAPLFPRSMSTLKTQAARGWPTGSAAISKPGVKHLASCIIKIKPTLRKWRGH
jgi:inorganic triphosphatase YgiF